MSKAIEYTEAESTVRRIIDDPIDSNPDAYWPKPESEYEVKNEELSDLWR